MNDEFPAISMKHILPLSAIATTIAQVIGGGGIGTGCRPWGRPPRPQKGAFP